MDQGEQRRAWDELLADEQASPRSWLREADELKRAADLVGSCFQAEANESLKTLSPRDNDEARFNAFELGDVALMLIGYAIEVAAKGIIIARDATPRNIDRITKRHIDEKLLAEAGIELSSGDGFLVGVKLFHAVRWSGRYPSPRPKDSDLFFEQLLASQGSIFSNPGSLSPGMYRRSCELFDVARGRLVEHLEA